MSKVLNIQLIPKNQLKNAVIITEKWSMVMKRCKRPTST